MDLVRQKIGESLNKKFGEWVVESEPEPEDYLCYVCTSTDWTVEIIYWPKTDDDNSEDIELNSTYTTVEISVFEGKWADKIDEFLSGVKEGCQNYLTGQAKLDQIRSYLTENLPVEVPKWTLRGPNMKCLDFRGKLIIFHDHTESFDPEIFKFKSCTYVKISGFRNPEKNLKFLKTNIERFRTILLSK